MSIKRIIALLLAVILLVGSAVGCGYNPDVVMTVNNIEISSGVFLMMQLTAYYDAQEQMNGEILADLTVLDTLIDEKPARDWIRDETDRLCKEYAYVESECARLGIALDEVSSYYAEYYAQSTWSSNRALYEANGISYDSLLKLNQNSMLRSQLMDNLYGAGGEREIPENEKEDYFALHYARADYLTIPTIDTAGVALPEAQMTQMLDIAQQMLSDARSHGMEQAFLNHYEAVLRLTGEIPSAESAQEEVDTVSDTPITVDSALFDSTANLDVMINDRETTFGVELYGELLAAEIGSFQLFVGEDGSLVLYRRNAFHEDDTYETYASTILVYLAQDPFTAAIEEDAAVLEILGDDRARDYYGLDKIQL